MQLDEKSLIKRPRRQRTGTARLDLDAWIDAAMTELAANGIDGIRVEVLATRLSVTKGSFYWHFKDRDALLVAILDRWRRRATVALIERLDRDHQPPRDRLLRLLRLPIVGEHSSFAADVELSVRLWGRRDERARAALAEVDELRLHYITRLLVDNGTASAEARSRAILAYTYLRVAPTLIPADAIATMQQCEHVLIG